MEEAAFLRAVQHIVGGVQVEHDLLGRPLVRIEEELHEEGLQARRVAVDPVVLRGVALRLVLQAIERALAGQRRTVRALGRQLAGEHRESRIVAQLVMIVEVVIAQRQAENALTDQGLDRVLEQRRIPTVGETGGQAPDQSEAAIQLPQKHGSGIRCDGSDIESGQDFLAFESSGSGKRRSADLIFRIMGWTNDRFERVTRYSARRMGDTFCEGEVDILIGVLGIPAELYDRITRECGSMFLSLPQRLIDGFKQTGPFLVTKSSLAVSIPTIRRSWKASA